MERLCAGGRGCNKELGMATENHMPAAQALTLEAKELSTCMQGMTSIGPFEDAANPSLKPLTGSRAGSQPAPPRCGRRPTPVRP